MKLWIANPHKAVRLTITVMKTRKPPSPTTQIWLTMTKAATAPSAARKTFDSTVARMHISPIK